MVLLGALILTFSVSVMVALVLWVRADMKRAANTPIAKARREQAAAQEHIDAVLKKATTRMELWAAICRPGNQSIIETFRRLKELS